MKFFLLKCFSYFLGRLPNRALLVAGDVLGFFWFYLVPFRRKVVLENLTLAYGDSKTLKEIERLAARNFRHYGRALFESVRSVCWTLDDYRREVTFVGLDYLKAYVREKRGVFVLSFHMGAWELSPGSAAAHGLPIDVVTKISPNKNASELLNWFRQRLGIEVIPASRSKQLIVDAIGRGRFIGFMLDQFMGPPVGVPVKFFGKTAGTTVSLALLSEQHSVPILIGFTHRDKKGRLQTVAEPIDFPKFSDDFTTRLWEKTQFLNDCIEAKVRQFPEQWMWLHRRWKPFVGTPKWQKSPATVSENPLT